MERKLSNKGNSRLSVRGDGPAWQVVLESPSHVTILSREGKGYHYDLGGNKPDVVEDVTYYFSRGEYGKGFSILKKYPFIKKSKLSNKIGQQKFKIGDKVTIINTDVLYYDLGEEALENLGITRENWINKFQKHYIKSENGVVKSVADRGKNQLVYVQLDSGTNIVIRSDGLRLVKIQDLSIAEMGMEVSNRTAQGNSINKIVIASPHSKGTGDIEFDKEEHSQDFVSKPIAEQLEVLLTDLGVETYLFLADKSREDIDYNREEGRGSNWRERIREELDENTLLVDIHSYESDDEDFKDYDAVIYRHEGDKGISDKFYRELDTDFNIRIVDCPGENKAGEKCCDIVQESLSQDILAFTIETNEGINNLDIWADVIKNGILKLVGRKHLSSRKIVSEMGNADEVVKLLEKDRLLFVGRISELSKELWKYIVKTLYKRLGGNVKDLKIFVPKTNGIAETIDMGVSGNTVAQFITTGWGTSFIIMDESMFAPGLKRLTEEGESVLIHEYVHRLLGVDYPDFEKFSEEEIAKGLGKGKTKKDIEEEIYSTDPDELAANMEEMNKMKRGYALKLYKKTYFLLTDIEKEGIKEKVINYFLGDKYYDKETLSAMYDESERYIVSKLSSRKKSIEKIDPTIVDKDIRDLVMTMRDYGINTTESCAGHDYECMFPFISWKGDLGFGKALREAIRTLSLNGQWRVLLGEDWSNFWGMPNNSEGGELQLTGLSGQAIDNSKIFGQLNFTKEDIGKLKEDYQVLRNWVIQYKNKRKSNLSDMSWQQYEGTNVGNSGTTEKYPQDYSAHFTPPATVDNMARNFRYECDTCRQVYSEQSVLGDDRKWSEMRSSYPCPRCGGRLWPQSEGDIEQRYSRLSNKGQLDIKQIVRYIHGGFQVGKFGQKEDNRSYTFWFTVYGLTDREMKTLPLYPGEHEIEKVEGAPGDYSIEISTTNNRVDKIFKALEENELVEDEEISLSIQGISLADNELYSGWGEIRRYLATRNDPEIDIPTLDKFGRLSNRKGIKSLGTLKRSYQLASQGIYDDELNDETLGYLEQLVGGLIESYGNTLGLGHLVEQQDGKIIWKDSSLNRLANIIEKGYKNTGWAKFSIIDEIVDTLHKENLSQFISYETGGLGKKWDEENSYNYYFQEMENLFRWREQVRKQSTGRLSNRIGQAPVIQPYTPQVPVSKLGKIPLPEEFAEEEEGEELPEPIPKYLSKFQGISWAGRNLHLIRIDYDRLDGTRRTMVMEPYSYRMRRPKRLEGGIENYFFAYDQNENTIKGMIRNRVKKVSVLPETFSARWEIEV